MEALESEIDAAIADIDISAVNHMHSICDCLQHLQSVMTHMLNTGDARFGDSFASESKDKRKYYTLVQVFERKRKSVLRIRAMILAALSTLDSGKSPNSSPPISAALIAPVRRLPTPEESTCALDFITAAHSIVDDTMGRVDQQKGSFLTHIEGRIEAIAQKVDAAVDNDMNRLNENASKRRVFVKRDLLEQRQDLVNTLRSIKLISSTWHPSATYVAPSPARGSLAASASPERNAPERNPPGSQDHDNTPPRPPNESNTPNRNISGPVEHPPPTTPSTMPALSNTPGSGGTLDSDTALGSAYISDTWKMR